VTILNSAQREVSERFAGRTTEDEDRFNGLETFSLGTGSPLLAGGLAFFDCRVVSAQDYGDNTLFVGEVVSAGGPQSGDPLVYYDRDYRRLAG
jgi:flavin reductase (DIM6/NTAB) family NADH-FMN oxidoreductase RutF